MANANLKSLLDQLGTPQRTAQFQAPSLTNQVSAVSVQPFDAIQPTRATPYSAAQLSELYGNVNYDQDAIRGIFDAATEAEYAAKNKAYDRTAGQYYNRLATAQESYLDTMRKANANAIQSGANTGMQNANMLSAMLGISQQTTGDATELAQEARGLADQEAQARSKDARDALEYANAQKLALGQMGVNLAGVDAQQYAAELAQLAQISAANVAAQAQQYSADRGLQGTMYNADANTAGQRYAADSSYDSSVYNTQGNLAGNVYASDNNLRAAQTSAAATRAAAGSAASAQRYAANVNATTQENIAEIQGNYSLKLLKMDADIAAGIPRDQAYKNAVNGSVNSYFPTGATK